MSKFINILIISFCLLMTACSSHDDEPETISPIQFRERDYTIVYGRSSAIHFTGGGNIYELEASNPEVLGKFGIDIETHRLIINPAKTGVSTLNIIDVKTGTSFTLNITVEDYYLPFRIEKIDGTNTNKFFQRDAYVQFIRNEDNTKPVKIVWYNHITFQGVIRAEGSFDISRSDTYIYTMTLSLCGIENEQMETFEYTMGGDGVYMNVFDSLFEFNWDKSVASSRSSQPRDIKMTLTDNSNGCKITCLLQPLKFDYD